MLVEARINAHHTVLLIICMISLQFIYQKTKSERNKIKYMRIGRGDKHLSPLPVFKMALNTLDSELVNDSRQANLIFLERFNSHRYLLEHPICKDAKLYSLISVDYIACKASLYVLAAQDRATAKYFPMTFVLSDDRHLKMLKEYVETHKHPVILKSNVQQQMGCKIVSDLDEIELENFVVAQELLTRPFLVFGKKINLRIYLLISCDEDLIFKVHTYDDGFVYYAPMKYVHSSTDFNRNITTGLLPREFYKAHPETLRDLEKVIRRTEINVLKKNIKRCFRTVFSAIKDDLLQIESSYSIDKFVLMGADVAVDDHLNVKIMEINKGPDLSFKGEKDKELKVNMVREMFRFIFEKKDKNGGEITFQRIL